MNLKYVFNHYVLFAIIFTVMAWMLYLQQSILKKQSLVHNIQQSYYMANMASEIRLGNHDAAVKICKDQIKRNFRRLVEIGVDEDLSKWESFIIPVCDYMRAEGESDFDLKRFDLKESFDYQNRKCNSGVCRFVKKVKNEQVNIKKAVRD